MNFKIIQLSDNICEKTRTQEFLFKQIKKEYGYGYVPEYHKDIINLNEYYINPRKNNLFLAKNSENDEIIATIAVRGYDKKFKEFEDYIIKKILQAFGDYMLMKNTEDGVLQQNCSN